MTHSKLYLMISLILLAAACTGSPTATLPPPGTFAPQPRDQATAVPPAWVEGAEEITLATVARISYIGRLDAQGPASTVFAYAFSPDSSRLAGLNNEQLVVWDLINGQIVFNTARADALFVYYGVDKTEIYTVDSNGFVSVYDADQKRLKDNGVQGHPKFNSLAAYEANNGWLALAGSDGTVKVWDIAARQSLVTINAHNQPVIALAFSADGNWLATAGGEGVVTVWNWRERQALATIPVAASRIAFAPNGKQLAIAEAQQISLWNMPDGTVAHTLKSGPGAASDVLLYSPTSEYLVNAGNIPNMTVWDTATGTLVNTLPGVGGDTTSAAFSPSGDVLATSTLGGLVTLWDVSKIREPILNRADLAVNTRQILYADWSLDGHLLTLFDATGPVQVWGIPGEPTPAE